ncbi:MAG: hypothetical protein ACKVQB_09240 [Bacteroidia bacterium]
MNKKILIFLFFIISGKIAIGQTYPITILSQQPLSVLPGQTTTVVLKVYNDDTIAVKFSSDFAKQNNLSCIMCKQVINVEPKTEKTIILPLMVNKNTLPCLIKIMFKLFSNDSVVTEKEIVLEIERKINFSVDVISAPDFVRGGEPIIAKTVIQNNGNITSNFRIKKHGFTDKNSNFITLKPGEILNYDIIINTNPNQVKPDFLTYGIKVVSPDDSSKTHDVFRSTYVFPVAETKKSQYFSIPGNIKLNYLISNRNNSSASGYQVEAFFKGSLDQANKHKVELSIRGPNRFSSSVLGMYDEYYAKYKNQVYDVHLGDKVFSLSTLTEVSRFARGIEVSRNKANLTLGGFFNMPRFNSTIKNEYAGYATYLFKNNLKLGINHLSKQGSIAADQSKLNSIVGSYSNKDKFSLESEISKSKHLKLKDYGFRSSVFYKQTNFNINFSMIITGKNFAGYYKNTSYYVLNTTYILNRKTDLNFNYNKDYQNPLLDTIVRIAPSNNSYFIGLTRRINKTLSTRLLYRASSVQDRSSLNNFNYKSNQIQLSINQKFRTFGYSFIGDIGYNRNLLLSEDSSLSSLISIFAELQFYQFNNIRVSIFQNFLNSNRYSYKNENTLFYGGVIAWRVNTKLNASLRYQSNYFPEDYYRNRDAIDLRVKYNTGKRLDFTVATRYVFLAQQSTAKELYIQFGANYKIYIPIKKIASYGKVNGVITSKTGKSVKDILVHLDGRTAITRKDGSYVFNNVPAGSYFLFVDQASLLLNEIVEQITPIKVDVIENKASTINFNIIAAAKITGRVKVVFKKNAYYDDTTVTEVPPVVLILKNEFESQTIISAGDGTFYFKNIKPGNWKLTAYDNLLDNKYIIEKEQFVFDLQSDQNIELLINIRKKEKKIHFLQQPKK